MCVVNVCVKIDRGDLVDEVASMFGNYKYMLSDKFLCGGGALTADV